MASLFEVIMPSRVMLFVAPAFFYQMAFFFGGNILNGAKISFKYAAPLFASINAGLLLAVSYKMMSVEPVPLEQQPLRRRGPVCAPCFPTQARVQCAHMAGH